MREREPISGREARAIYAVDLPAGNGFDRDDTAAQLLMTTDLWAKTIGVNIGVCVTIHVRAILTRS
jgi:hypothetical protein